MRKLLLHGIGHLVDEPDDDARMPSVLVLDGLALLALAEQEIVVLREAVDAVIGVVAHELQQPFFANFKNLGIREAELAVSAEAFAVAQAEILGMRLVELLC